MIWAGESKRDMSQQVKHLYIHFKIKVSILRNGAQTKVEMQESIDPSGGTLNCM